MKTTIDGKIQRKEKDDQFPDLWWSLVVWSKGSIGTIFEPFSQKNKFVKT